jgi:phosphoglycolate phosphatase
MARLRALYVDLDHTLLGLHASLFHDGEGRPSNLGARAIEACHRSGVEVVPMSGRRGTQVREDSRMLGARSYIFEAGSAVVDEGEHDWLTAPYLPGELSVHEQIARTGVPDRLLAEHDPLELHAPWHLDREVSHLFKGAVDALAISEAIAGHELRLVDNGAVQAHPGWRAYHLLPVGVSKGRAVARHMRRRGYAPEECIAVGDSREDVTAAEAVGTLWLVANHDPECAPTANTRVAEGANGAGVYEAVVTELAER